MQTVTIANNVVTFENATFRIRAFAIQKSNIEGWMFVLSYGDERPFQQSFVANAHLDFAYRALTAREEYLNFKAILDSRAITFEQFQEHLRVASNVYLPQYNWAIEMGNGGGKMFNRSHRDRVAITPDELAAVQDQAARNRLKYQLLIKA
jgi:hypothetical protein